MMKSKGKLQTSTEHYYKYFCNRYVDSLYVLQVNHSHFLLGNFLYNTEPFLPGLSLYGN